MFTNATTPTTIHTILGTWSPAETRPNHQNFDLEAQVVTGFYEIGPSTISGSSPAHPRAHGIDPLDAFFGASRGTQDSRYYDMHHVAVYQDDVPPPPYAGAGELPAYAAAAEPPTLAMYLFKFGFCKYPRVEIWILDINYCLLCSIPILLARGHLYTAMPSDTPRELGADEV